MQAALALVPQEDREVKGVTEFMLLVQGSYMLNFHATGLLIVSKKVLHPYCTACTAPAAFSCIYVRHCMP